MNKLPLLLSSVVITVIVASALISKTSAQIASRPIRVPASSSAGDWHGFKSERGMFRYNATTGTTQEMTFTSAQGSSKISWANVDEDKTQLPGAGPFEVIEGDRVNAMALRIERTTGRAWIMYGVKGGKSYWASAGNN